MGHIADLVAKQAEPMVSQLGLELWHIEFGKEAGGVVLRVTIDKEGGISTEDCEAVSRALDLWLDEADPISQSYTLEVSSPGIERVLYTEAQKRRYIGALVNVKLYKARDGQRVFTGILRDIVPDIVLEQPQGTVTFPQSEVAQIRVAM